MPSTAPQQQSTMNLLATWIPSLITVASLVYFVGVRDNRQDVDASTLKALDGKVQILIEDNFHVKRDITELGNSIADLKSDLESYGDMKRDVSCLKSAFKTGGDPSKC